MISPDGDRLDQEMLALGDGIGHRMHHLDLSRPLHPPDTLHCGIQKRV
jgi:hypothetical protein